MSATHPTGLPAEPSKPGIEFMCRKRGNPFNELPRFVDDAVRAETPASLQGTSYTTCKLWTDGHR